LSIGALVVAIMLIGLSPGSAVIEHNRRRADLERRLTYRPA
jgi:hypothetical protein